MTDELQNAIDIAVLREQISGLREQGKQHAETTKIQFDKVVSKLEAIDKTVSEIQTSAKVGWKTIVGIGSAVIAVVGTLLAYFK